MHIADAGDGKLVSGASTLGRGILALNAPAMRLMQSASGGAKPVTVTVRACASRCTTLQLAQRRPSSPLAAALAAAIADCTRRSRLSTTACRPARWT